ncbi:TlyA family RNA methyltransferase [Roseibium litorale]|uniref:TlyA family RNA methyltransferase n=1 Tax=Roseibium litorale TaxID=2803841 RepID=A0ABR9CR63_9HYPH|nr:TlyA family RNA methyltransferase [Roseibium litorale]MBD8893109.1 TlyA family RNA methyltransferase [Roseibium litorale]
MTRQRLDQHLVDTGHFQTRARARDAILRGTVSVDGALCLKPGQKVASSTVISVADPAAAYVSRAALKLIEGLDVYGIDPKGLICLDIGASTGGFTQVLLERGASKVHAIDVGHGQLHETIASHPDVRRRDGLNARDLTLEDLDGNRPQLLVSDVSFISLKLALPPALDLAAPGACGVFLVKPQFESGRENIGKGGLVDPDVAEKTAAHLQDWLAGLPGWTAGDLVPSPVKGGDGNAEWLLSGYKNG